MPLASRLLRVLLASAPPALGIIVFACGLTVSQRYRIQSPDRPPLGELVRFQPHPRAAAMPGPATVFQAGRLAGTGLGATATATTCRSEAAALLGTAGSLLVVAVEPGGETVQVRWAGGPTATAGGCEGGDGLRLNRYAYVALRNLAEFGVPVLPTPVLP